MLTCRYALEILLLHLMLCVNCNDRTANNRNLDQTAQYVKADLGLHCFCLDRLLAYNTILIQSKKILLFRILDKSRTLVKSV